MPRISFFHGISVYMYFGDHGPPHFHATYAGRWGRLALDGTILAGNLPVRAERLIRKWARVHRSELRACWDRASRNEPPGTIEPLP